MIIDPPGNWMTLADWLHSLAAPVGSLFESHVQYARQEHTDNGVWLWLVGQESPQIDRIDRIVELLAQSGPAELQGLTGLEQEFLRMRIMTAHDWIEQFLVSGTSPIEFPQTPFPDVLEWLLVDWWKAHGSRLHARELFVLSRS